MAIGNQINGVIRDTTESLSKINGVWRENINGWTKINGVWRDGHNQAINPNHIVGFKFCYTLNKNRIHHDIPYLSYNPNIPYRFDITGETSTTMDQTEKGVVFEYLRDEPEEEGIVVYEGRLYAVLDNGSLVNVSAVVGNNNDKIHEDELISEFSSIHDLGRLNNLNITIVASVAFEDYGYYFNGWNNIFNTKPFIDQTIYPDKMQYRKTLKLDNYNILPTHIRDEYFDSVSTIGIARDMQTPVNNMVGSYGVLSHTIFSINLNGKDMPFMMAIE